MLTALLVATIHRHDRKEQWRIFSVSYQDARIERFGRDGILSRY